MRKYYYLVLTGLLWSVVALSNDGDPMGNQLKKSFVFSASGETKWGLIHYPSNFFSTSVRYPLLVFNHGVGEVGGTEESLSKLNIWGPGWFMANQNWPVTAINPLTGRSYEFLYFAMQDNAWSPSVD